MLIDSQFGDIGGAAQFPTPINGGVPLRQNLWNPVRRATRFRGLSCAGIVRANSAGQRWLWFVGAWRLAED
jgi:hypothetical protein